MRAKTQMTKEVESAINRCVGAAGFLEEHLSTPLPPSPILEHCSEHLLSKQVCVFCRLHLGICERSKVLCQRC